MGTIHTPSTWDSVDTWWESFVETEPVVRTAERTRWLDDRWMMGGWETMDSWWAAFSAVREADVAEVLATLERSDREWEQSDSRFDVDPLATDWTPRPDTPGPLRPNQEENWSQWLAHLLRDPPSEFLGVLFGDDVGWSPEAVRREVHFQDSIDPDRYADILVLDGEQGVSIEVKRNDEHYWKTLHTAALIEADDTRNWQHFLLVPKYKDRAVRQTFGENISDPDDGQPVISVAGDPPITVLYWRDISTALRSVLKSGEVRDGHWAASAYLFCTLIEQKILQLIPTTTVDQIAASDDVIHASQTLSVATGGVDEQLQYLRGTMEDNNE